MKKQLIIGSLAAIIFCGCTTSQQTTAYTTISTVEQTATAAVDGYYKLVISGTITTNNVPTVSQAYNDLQAAGVLAAEAGEAGTNSLASSNLVQEASSLGALITNIENTK
jgi:hypothetical protein